MHLRLYDPFRKDNAFDSAEAVTTLARKKAIKNGDILQTNTEYEQSLRQIDDVLTKTANLAGRKRERLRLWRLLDSVGDLYVALTSLRLRFHDLITANTDEYQSRRREAVRIARELGLGVPMHLIDYSSSFERGEIPCDEKNSQNLRIRAWVS